MSEFRVEKRRAAAEVTLASGLTLRGSFFLAGSSASHTGPERVADLLNTESGFFPFEVDAASGRETALYNRSHLVCVKLLEDGSEARLDPGYELATERHVAMLLSNGRRISGAVRIYRPAGRDRLSDYTRSSDAFRYLEAADATFIVNSTHIVELRETPKE